MRPNNITFTLALVILLLLSLSSYCITEFSNAIQLRIAHIEKIPTAYGIAFALNNIVAALIPLGICLFIFSTSKIVICDIFERKLNTKQYFCTICFSFIPFLVYNYFLWYNLIKYVNGKYLSTAEDLLNMKYIWGLTLNDLSIINTGCWFYIYGHLIIYLLSKGISIHISLLSILLPPLLVYISLTSFC
jgi:hypothetical protein